MVNSMCLRFSSWSISMGSIRMICMLQGDWYLRHGAVGIQTLYSVSHEKAPVDTKTEDKGSE